MMSFAEVTGQQVKRGGGLRRLLRNIDRTWYCTQLFAIMFLSIRSHPSVGTTDEGRIRTDSCEDGQQTYGKECLCVEGSWSCVELFPPTNSWTDVDGCMVMTNVVPQETMETMVRMGPKAAWACESTQGFTTYHFKESEFPQGRDCSSVEVCTYEFDCDYYDSTELCDAQSFYDLERFPRNCVAVAALTGKEDSPFDISDVCEGDLPSTQKTPGEHPTSGGTRSAGSGESSGSGLGKQWWKWCSAACEAVVLAT